ncbi:MAG: tRNA (adenosine(37)-N6)-threonylcarbamoyltransferase complex dimerization subunit type 1 TsaB [Desulfobacterales bacterium]|jgi:tRNA threonylcarbamoyladenosine biosynthesis protein TsaB|nr:tRNA (adenosine(37)-N6)-threonylcarbamoyltransferase complex dimerization subunit type 1 TsaB [Desulfobacterales bacterium]
MRILAVDTAAKSCSVAIMAAGSLSAELITLKDETHSKHLMELIHKVLGMAGFRVGELDGLAVTIGPGSFTGLRIGVSTVKGLAHALNKPVVGVSSLDALAWQCADRSHLICALLDARKGEVYSATYRFENDTLTQKSLENVTAPEAAVEGLKEPCVFIGSGAQLYRRNITNVLGNLANFAPEDQNIIRASSVGFLSMEKFKTHDTSEAAGLVPHYIRKSDAELNF